MAHLPAKTNMIHTLYDLFHISETATVVFVLHKKSIFDTPRGTNVILSLRKYYL